MSGIELPITKETNLGQLIMEHPVVAEVLMDYGLHCVGCIAATFDSVEAGAKIHGMSDEDISEMVQRLNEVVQHGE